MPYTISILGCGWLGLPLGKALAQSGYAVKGSTTSPQKLEMIKAAGIKPFLLTVEDEVEAVEKTAFFNADLLILNLPPGGRRDPAVEENYPRKIKAVLNEVSMSPVQKLLFVSSTGVYGNENDTVDENTPLEPNTASGKALDIIERFLGLQQGLDITVLRLGGLIGGERKPGRFLAGKKDVPNGEAPVNLVHRDDCIGVIEAIIQQDLWGETFNVVADEHPTRAEFYTAQAEKEKLEPPTFVANSNLAYKIVSNEKVKAALGYTFKWPDPRAF
jgi:nucleoside-diphosphate-sugar epimerase